ncbi:hypothetical protein E2542_SST27433 [Spatholobus suberectus]|nr:hypothetical protein E2542_SST27433 [Spatholobus suberectus]
MIARQEEEMEESTNSELWQWMKHVILGIMEISEKWEESRDYLPFQWAGRGALPSAIRNDQPCGPFGLLQERHAFVIKHLSDDMKMHKESNKAKMDIYRSDSPNLVVNIAYKNGLVEGDQKMTNECKSFREFFLSSTIRCTLEHDGGTLCATLYGVQLGQLAPRGYSFEVDVMKEGNQLLLGRRSVDVPFDVMKDEKEGKPGGGSSDVMSTSDCMMMDEEGNQAKMDNYRSDPPHHVVNIAGKNGVVEGDQKMTNESKSFLEFILSRIIHCTPERDRGTLYAALYGVQFGQVWALDNPFDKLSHFTSTGKGTEELLLSFGQAHSMFLPPIIWSAMFCLNITCTSMLAWSLPYRVPLVSMLGLSLVDYFLALEGAMSGFNVLLGSTKMSGLMIVSGGAVG